MQVLSTKTQQLSLWHKLHIRVICLTKDAHNTLYDNLVIKTSNMFSKKAFAERKANKECRSNVLKMYQPKILLETVLFESLKTIRYPMVHVFGFSTLLDMIWMKMFVFNNVFIAFLYSRVYILINHVILPTF